MKSGVPGIVHKTDALDYLIMAIRTVSAGGSYYSPRIHEFRTSFAANPNFFAKILSPREQTVLEKIGRGDTTEQIVTALGISEATCIDHRKNVMLKLGLHRQSDLVAHALEKGFV